MQRKIAVIILAAGKSIRMKSTIPKILHKVCGRPMISYILDLSLKLKAEQIILVLNRESESVLEYLKKNYCHKGIEIAIQDRPLGTADAVLKAKHKIKHTISDLLILYGDNPLLSLSTIRKVLFKHYATCSSLTLLTAELDEPSGYGRIVRDEQGRIVSIGEDKDLKKEELQIKEVNAGSCVFKKEELFKIIKDIKPNNKKREYYLTEAVRLLSKAGKKISSVITKDSTQVLGVNRRIDLIKIEHILRKKLINDFLKRGVTIVSPDTTFINAGVKIGKDTIVNPFVYIDNNVRIGRNCIIGPFSHIRGGSRIKDNVVVGSFTELTRSNIDDYARIKHFSYLGDAKIGKDVNIGAGVVTANFDGRKKHKTEIGDNAFIGSDTILIAPVKIGKSAVCGAGCVVTKGRNVPDNSIVFGVPAKLYKRGKNG
jgi:bifunctional UDP-N-acetylglucosamine pyrophosphorylase/glucosamine-1-phosphate N-acetyltransferase